MFVDFPEVVIIFGVALVVLGPKKLPGTAAQVGRWVGRARAMARQFREQLEQEVGTVESALDINAKPSSSRKPAAQPQPDAGAQGGGDAQGGAGIAEHSADLAWHPEYGTDASDAPYGDPHLAPYGEPSLAPYGDPSLAPYGDPTAVPPSGTAAEGQLPLELDAPEGSPASAAHAAPARTPAATPESAAGAPEGR